MSGKNRQLTPGGMRGGRRSLLRRVELALLACEGRPLSRGQADLCSAVYHLLLTVKAQTVLSQGGTKRT